MFVFVMIYFKKVNYTFGELCIQIVVLWRYYQRPRLIIRISCG